MSNQSTSDPDRRIRVATWNIQHGRGLDDRYDIDRIADEIDRCDPDVIGLQEVDRNFRPRSNFDDGIEILADRLDMQYRFGGTILAEPTAESGDDLRRFGIAILCKRDYPIQDSQQYILPRIEYADRKPSLRGLLETRIDVGGRPLFFYNTHLALTEDQRLRQARTILDLTARQPGPHVLVGDFNATPASPPIELVRDRYEDVATYSEEAGEYTYPAGDPDRRIDYVFVSTDVCVADATVRGTTASDHRPVESTLELPAADR